MLDKQYSHLQGLRGAEKARMTKQVKELEEKAAAADQAEVTSL
jgi:hypothetical protein